MSYLVSSDLSIHFAIKTRTALAFVKGVLAFCYGKIVWRIDSLHSINLQQTWKLKN